IDMVEIGVGGGSIARVSALETIAVGPDSAGSDPGPACYALGGTEPTVTDADLVLGYLDPGYFLGGRLRLDVDAARRSIAAPLAVELVRARRALLDELDWAEALFAEMEEEGAQVLRAAGVEDVSHARSADLRYVGQGHELRVDVPPEGAGALAGEFVRLYREL